MPQLIRIVALLVMVVRIAHAGSSNARVVLVDPDPELRRAMTTALAPWKLEVIVDERPQLEPAARATELSARFVVWRDGRDLVVFDAEHGASVRRGGQAGTLDAVAAASSALTVKTLMRLPPPSEPATRSEGLPASLRAGAEIRVQAGVATRITAGGSDTEIGGRFEGAMLVRPIGNLGLRVGVIADLGGSSSVDRSGFKGSWADFDLLLAGSFTIAHGHLELEPFVAGGIERSSFDGTDGGMGGARTERATLALLRAGGWVRWRLGMWTIGGIVALDAVAGTPTYTKTPGNALIYEVPSSAVTFGVVFAADLGR